MRIGILGGTFDPIHYGHIRPALEVKAQLNLDAIWLMPNHIPPHKLGPKTSSAHRLAMVHLVCDLYPEFDCCDIEIRRDSPSYTVTSLEALTQVHPEHEFYFIMGMDSFMQLESWYLWQALFDLCQLVVCQRPGWKLCSESNMAKRLKQACLADEARQDSGLEVKTDTSTRGKIFPVTITEQDISSTDIKAKLRQGADLSQLMPAAILSYIKQHQLYP